MEEMSIECKQCDGGLMGKIDRVEKSLALQLLGVLIFLVGLGLLFLFPIGTIFGLGLMIGAARLGYSKKKVWCCTTCGYFFEIA